MKRIAIALSLSALGCLLYCLAPVLLLLIGGASVGAAITEWKDCYRNPFLLGSAGVLGGVMMFFGVRTWYVRGRSQRLIASSQILPQRSEPPIACTLASGDLKARLVELADLSRVALADVRREDLTLFLHYFPEAEVRVRQMVEKEMECCAFLTFEFEFASPFLVLRITAPEAARAVVQDIYAQFTIAKEKHTDDF